MTLKMGDGPVANLPAGLDAYGGYVNRSGIGVTYPGVVSKFPTAKHLSITTNGSAALCADVESGAMRDWTHYTYGYCSVSAANVLIARFGRPKKLWLAHYDPNLGAHICSPRCWPGLVTEADGTQWVDHNGQWDESLLKDDFFDIAPPSTKETDVLITPTPTGNGYWICKDDGSIWSFGDAQYHGGMNYPKNVLLPGDHPTGLTSHPTEQGYWIVTALGGVYAYGAAAFHGGVN
jgi:hypothetical protein